MTLSTLDAPDLNKLSDDLTVLSTHQHSGAAGDGAGLWFPAWANDQLINHRIRLGRTFSTGGSGTTAAGDEVIRAAGATYDLSAVKDSTANWPAVNWAIAGNGYVSCETLYYADSELRPVFDLIFAHVDTTNLTVRMGFENIASDGFSADQTEAAMFRVATTGRWYAVCRSGGSETAQDTGVAWSTTPKHFRVEFITSARVTFSIDGVEVADLTTNTPAVDMLLAAGFGFNHPAAGTVNARTGQVLGLRHKVKSS